MGFAYSMTGQRSTMVSGPDPYIELPDRSPHPQEQSALVNCTALLWRERTLLARGIAVGGLLTLLIALLVPNRYESSTRLMSPDMRGSASEALMTGLPVRGGGSGGGGLVALGANLLGIGDSGAVFIGVLNSRSVA